jgi:LysR family nitrogen assimilation transcriptional regulator
MEAVLDLKDLKALLVVGRDGSITGAARTLNISQPDLSRLLQRLEDKLGQPLLVRHARGVRLTPAGAILAESAEKALSLLREAAAEINATSDTLRLLIVPPSYGSFSAPRAAYFNAA